MTETPLDVLRWGGGSLGEDNCVHIAVEGAAVAARGRLVCQLINGKDKIVEAEGRGPCREAALERMFAAAAATPGFRYFSRAANVLSDATPDKDRLLLGQVARRDDALDLLLSPGQGILLRVVAKIDGTGAWTEVVLCGRRHGQGWIDGYAEAHAPKSFHHSWPVAADLVRPESGDVGVAADYRERFMTDVNPAIDDPYLDHGDSWLAGEPPQWTKGSEQEFRRVLQMFGALESFHEPIFVPVCCDIKTGACRIDKDGADERLTPRFRRLARLALKEHAFVAAELEYNDGRRGRRSGYSRSGATIHFTVEPQTGHQRAQAMKDVRAWLRARVPAKEAERILQTRSARRRRA